MAYNHAEFRNVAIEFHDSCLEVVKRHESSLEIYLSLAIVHRSNSEVGIDPGTVWTQPAILMLGNGTCTEELPLFPLDISDGEVYTLKVSCNGIVPVPFTYDGPVAVMLSFADRNKITLKGDSLRIQLQGEPLFLEEFE